MIDVNVLIKFLNEGKVPNPGDAPEVMAKKLSEEEEQIDTPATTLEDEIPAALEEPVNPEGTPDYQKTILDTFGIDINGYAPAFPGGKSEGKKPTDFPLDQLLKGISVEREHTTEGMIALEIAMDHLTERPDYYNALEQIEEPEEEEEAEAEELAQGTEEAEMKNTEALPNSEVPMAEPGSGAPVPRNESKINETSNGQVMDMFLSNGFPKDKMPSWGTANLKIEKSAKGWGLKNYATWLAFRDDNAPDMLYVNNQKYSVTTSRIQNELRTKAQSAGVNIKFVAEEALNQLAGGVNEALVDEKKIEGFTEAEIRQMPTISQAHFANLKYDKDGVRIYVSRMTKADGAKKDHAIEVEHLVNGVWTDMSESKLTTKGRKHIAPENFVFPKEKRYPIHDISHARNALARVATNGTPEEKAKVRAKVHAKYPSLKDEKEKNEGKVPNPKETDVKTVKTLLERFQEGQEITIKAENLHNNFDYAGQKGIAFDVPEDGNYVGVQMASDNRIVYFSPEDIDGGKAGVEEIKPDMEGPNDGEKNDIMAAKEDMEKRGEIDSQAGVSNESKINEVSGYALKDADKRVMKAFLDQQEADSRNMQSTDGVLSTGFIPELAKWVGDNKIKVSIAYGNVSQTWVNAIKKMAKQQGILIEESKVSEAVVNEEIQITPEELLAKVKAPENARMYKLVMGRLAQNKQTGELSHERALSMLKNLIQPIAHLLYVEKSEQVVESSLPYDAVVAQVAEILAQEVMGGVTEAIIPDFNLHDFEDGYADGGEGVEPKRSSNASYMRGYDRAKQKKAPEAARQRGLNSLAKSKNESKEQESNMTDKEVMGGVTESFEDEHGIEGGEQEEENDEIEPDEDDIFISSNGFKLSVSAGGKFLGKVTDEAEADELIKQWQAKSPNFFPSMWYVDDHGGIQPYRMNESRVNEVSEEDALAAHQKSLHGQAERMDRDAIHKELWKQPGRKGPVTKAEVDAEIEKRKKTSESKEQESNMTDKEVEKEKKNEEPIPTGAEQPTGKDAPKKNDPVEDKQGELKQGEEVSATKEKNDKPTETREDQEKAVEKEVKKDHAETPEQKKEEKKVEKKAENEGRVPDPKDSVVDLVKALLEADRVEEGKVPNPKDGDTKTVQTLTEEVLKVGDSIMVRNNRTNKEIQPELIGKTGRITGENHKPHGLYYSVMLDGTEDVVELEWRDIEGSQVQKEQPVGEGDNKPSEELDTNQGGIVQ